MRCKSANRLQHLPNRTRTDGGENLVKIRQHGIACHGAITEHGVVRLLLGDGGHDRIGHIAVKTGIQETVGDIEYLATRNGGFLNLGRKQNTEVEHYLEQQIFRCAVAFDVVDLLAERHLRYFVGAVVNVLHVGTVALENSESDV